MKCQKCGNKNIPKIEGKTNCSECGNEMIINYSPSKGKNYSEHMRKQQARKHKKENRKK